MSTKADYIYGPDGWFVHVGKGRYVRDANDSASPSPRKMVESGELVCVGEDAVVREIYYEFAKDELPNFEPKGDKHAQHMTGYFYEDHWQAPKAESIGVDHDDAERRTSQWMAMKVNGAKKNRLRGSACYLAGPMTACGDFGESWRKVITPHLRDLGVVVLDPTHKPIEIGQEDAAARAEFVKMKETGDLEGLRQVLKVIRRVDLRCIDLSSFIIVRLDGTDTVGTWEEIAMAVSQRKPTLIWLDGGLKKKDFNAWLLAQVKLEYVFESMEELLAYLKSIDEAAKHPEDHWWMLFDFNDLYKEVIQ